LEREVEKYNHQRVQNARAFGEIDHPPSWSPGFRSLSLETVSHVVLQLEWRGACLVGLVEILGTPAGRMLRDLYLQGKRLGVSSRSWATLNRKGSATFIGDDLDLIAFDYVSEPSTYGALMEPILERCLEPAHDHSALVCEAERASRFARRAFGKWTEKALRKRSGRNEGTTGGGAAQSLAEAVARPPKDGAEGGGEGKAGASSAPEPQPPGPQGRYRVPPLRAAAKGADAAETPARWPRLLWRHAPRGKGPPPLKEIWSRNRIHPEPPPAAPRTSARAA